MRSAVLVLLIGLAGLVAGPAPAQEVGKLHFTDIAGEAGINFKHNFGADRLQNVLMTTPSGCALFDYDNDGWLDIFLANGTYLDEQGRRRRDKFTRHALYHNKGDGTFENVTLAAGFSEPTYGQGLACGDYDADGFTDLYLTSYGANKLYHNKGDGTFEDVTRASGTGDARYGGGAVFFDYDGDGDLDLYCSNYVKFRPDMKGVHASSYSKRKGFVAFPGPRDYEAADDVMYRNNGDGTFTDVSKQVGLVSGGKGLSVIASDFDEDGDPDLFVANDATPNHLYRNDGGRFTEIALEAGVAYDPEGVETAAMGVDVADINGDGIQDLYVTNMIFEFNNLYQNQGKNFFKDVTKVLGLDRDNYRHVGWATRFVDFNLDGHLDCFVANGHVVDYVSGFSQNVTYGQQNFLFLGDGEGHFTDVADKIGDAFQRKWVGRGGAVGDIDNDGDMDIVIVNSGQPAELLRNDLPVTDRWVKLRLRAPAPNREAIGAMVVVKAGSLTYRREVRYATAYLSSMDPTVHIGLQPGVQEVSVEVTWPGGFKSTHTAPAGRLTVIEKPAAGSASE